MEIMVEQYIFMVECGILSIKECIFGPDWEACSLIGGFISVAHLQLKENFTGLFKEKNRRTTSHRRP